MRIRNKLTMNMLIMAMLPLTSSMGLALWHSTNQTTKLAIETTQGRLDTAAQKLSSFFSSRISEVSAYSQTALLKSMDFKQIRPFLISELDRHKNIYEKFILGTPKGYFYNTSGGNPYVGGLRTKNDNQPNAKPKHIRRRDYWQNTVGTNTSAQQNSFVSDPMISYTTGAKQIVVASTILSETRKVKGMIGGALPWSDIQKRIKQVNQEIVEQLGWDIKFFLISNTGTYWYHWNPDKVVHLKLDKSGKPFINDIGEKEIIKVNIKDEKIPELISAGKQMVKGKRGFTTYTDSRSNLTSYIVYSHIPSANYSIGLIIPKKQILSEVYNLQTQFIYIFLVVAILVIFIAYYASKNISSPIISLNTMAKQISNGDWSNRLKLEGRNEIRELTESFNTMAESLERREKLLKKSEERLLNAAGKLAHIGGWKLNIQNNKLEWTNETYNIHGLDKKRAIDIITASNYFIEESRTIFNHSIKHAKEDGEAFDLELRINTEQNLPRWVRVICEINKEADQIAELVGAYQDITELKKVEILKSEFVSTVSHELRTPLTAIRGSLLMMDSDKLDSVDLDTRNQMLSIAIRNSERLLLLINDLLDMEKIESGKMEFMFSDYDLKELIKQSLIENELYGNKFNISIKLVSDIPEVKINVDKERFFQVMANLISNAAKFSPENSTVEVSSKVDKQKVVISVQDYGSGIPEKFKDKIFTKFTQADGSDTKQAGGTGLGLSISKSIINFMGGEIDYESTPEKGSRFYFNLPVIS